VVTALQTLSCGVRFPIGSHSVIVTIGSSILYFY